MTKTNIKEIRTKYGFSQSYLADKLGISRITLDKIEKGERILKIFEKQKLDELLQEFDIEDAVNDSISFSNENSNIKNNIRIDSPIENKFKFKNVLFYILNKIGARPNVGKTVLYKLLYFIDFNYYEKFEKQIMGLTYIKAPRGPLPIKFKDMIQELEEGKEIIEINSKYFEKDQKKYIPLVSIEKALENLSGSELQIIDDVLNKYSNLTATEISEVSHRDTPWKVANNNEPLKYENAFHRTDEFSVGEYDEL